MFKVLYCFSQFSFLSVDGNTSKTKWLLQEDTLPCSSWRIEQFETTFTLWISGEKTANWLS